MKEYKTSDQIMILTTAFILQIVYAAFYGILGVPLFIIGLITLVNSTISSGSAIAMIVIGIIFMIWMLLSIIIVILIKLLLKEQGNWFKLVTILELVTLNIVGYRLLVPKKNTKNQSKEKK